LGAAHTVGRLRRAHRRFTPKACIDVYPSDGFIPIDFRRRVSRERPIQPRAMARSDTSLFYMVDLVLALS